MWNLRTRSRVGTFVEHGATAITVSADGSLLASGSGLGTVTIRDTDTMKRRGPIIRVGTRVSDLSFSPDGTTLAVSVGIVGDKQATVPIRSQLWNVRTRRPTGVTLDGHTGVVSQVQYSPDGKLLVTGGNDGKVLVRDSTTGTPVSAPLIGEFGAVNDLVFSPDGTQLGVGSLGNSGDLFDLATGARLLSKVGGTGGSTYVRITPDGAQFIVGSNRLTITNIADGSTVSPEIDTQHGPAIIADLAGFGLLLTGFDGTLTMSGSRAEAPRSHTCVARIAEHDAAYSSPDGSLIATSGTVDTVDVYQRVDRAPVATLSIGPAGNRDYFEAATPAAFSADNRLIAIGNREGDVQWFDTRTFQPRTAPVRVSDKGGALALTFSPDGRSLVAVVAEDGENGVHVVDLATREVEVVGSSDGLRDQRQLPTRRKRSSRSRRQSEGAPSTRSSMGASERGGCSTRSARSSSRSRTVPTASSSPSAVRTARSGSSTTTTHRPLGGRVASSGSLVATVERQR